jgi:hypothetical protein
VRYHVSEKRIRDPGSGTAIRVTREITIEVAAIGKIPRATPESLHVNNRNTDNRTRQFCRVKVVHHAADHLDAIEFVAVHGGCQAQCRAGQRPVEDQYRRRHRNTLEQFGRRPRKPPCGARRDLGIEDGNCCRRATGGGYGVSQRYDRQLGLRHRCIEQVFDRGSDFAGTRIRIFGRIFKNVGAVVAGIDGDLAREHGRGAQKG